MVNVSTLLTDAEKEILLRKCGLGVGLKRVIYALAKLDAGEPLANLSRPRYDGLIVSKNTARKIRARRNDGSLDFLKKLTDSEEEDASTDPPLSSAQIAHLSIVTKAAQSYEARIRGIDYDGARDLSVEQFAKAAQSLGQVLSELISDPMWHMLSGHMHADEWGPIESDAEILEIFDVGAVRKGLREVSDEDRDLLLQAGTRLTWALEALRLDMRPYPSFPPEPPWPEGMRRCAWCEQ